MNKKSVLFSVIILASVLLIVCNSQKLIKIVNFWEAGNIEADIYTDWEKQKEIEDTLRSYIASYEADKITYESVKDNNDKASIDLANAAKVRANRTAAIYNEYYKKNSHIWRNNIPYDILSNLSYIE